jgi:N-acetylmuramoyl-L-alanine amidase
MGYNKKSIGIELVNNGDGLDPFPPKQISALIELLRRLKYSYNISVDKIKGHGEIDTRMEKCGSISYKKKVDPGAAFPWQEVREALLPKPKPLPPINLRINP